VDKAERHLYRHRMRRVPRTPEERVTLPASVAPASVAPAPISREMADRVHARIRQNRQLAPRNNRQPAATICRGLAVCAGCGTRMTVINHNAYKAGPQSRCNIGTRTQPQRERCSTGGNSIMAAKLDAAVWAEMIALFETPGRLQAELAAALVQASDKREVADEPANDLARKIADAERRLANLRRQAELVDVPDQQEALAARITLLARDRDVWAHELEGQAANVARLRSKEDMILDFQQHVTAEHGSMEAWAGNFMRQLLLILDAWVEVWPLRAVQEGKTNDRAYVHVNLPLSGERRIALTRLLHAEHVLAAVGADAEGAHAANCAEHSVEGSPITRLDAYAPSSISSSRWSGMARVSLRGRGEPASSVTAM
jgi:Recombinase zinc beta ribbon domain